MSDPRLVRWSLGAERFLDLRPGAPCLMAIINVTPDSFSDGGLALDPARAIHLAEEAIHEGAAIIDIGGESTRPGAQAVADDEQICRVEPVIRGLRSRSDVIISVDTTQAAVAAAALDAGADIINDTSGGLDDPMLLPLVAARRCGVVLMHRRSAPAQEAWSHELLSDASRGARSIVERVRQALDGRLRAAREKGIHPEQIVLDPGLGFGKSVDENLELLHRLPEFASLGRPLLIGASRKSFIGAVTGVEKPSERRAGSIAAAVLAALGGAAILRVHEVAPHREAMSLLPGHEKCSRQVAAERVGDRPR
ncbi:MAG: dihydropteroate synthase [Phycisphaeraceae bacterium]|nr:dihydropteroate synthase [Phycisphaeraceae bacterium]